MNKIAAYAGIGGVLLAVLSQAAILNDWNMQSFFRILGLAGYIFIISAVAFFTLSLVNKWYKQEGIRDARRNF